MDSIPIVDLSPIVGGGAEFVSGASASAQNWHSVSEKIGQALKEIGFVYLINHGISTESIVSAFKEGEKFFKLSSEVKLKYTKKVSEEGMKGFHGYAPPSKEILNPTASLEFRESFDVKPGCTSPFPDEEIPGLRPALTALENQCRPIIRKLLQILAISLKLEDVDTFLNATTSLENTNIPSFTSFRSNYYPPLATTSEISSGAVRCSEHTDWGTITLLFQDSIGGLEVKRADGVWVKANPIPGSILLNTGDMLEIWSNGSFRATPHRVLIPDEEEKRRAQRQSIVYFVFPDDESLIKPANVIGNEENYSTAYQLAVKRMEMAFKY